MESWSQRMVKFSDQFKEKEKSFVHCMCLPLQSVLVLSVFCTHAENLYLSAIMWAFKLKEVSKIQYQCIPNFGTQLEFKTNVIQHTQTTLDEKHTIYDLQIK